MEGKCHQNRRKVKISRDNPYGNAFRSKGDNQRNGERVESKIGR